MSFNQCNPCLSQILEIWDRSKKLFLYSKGKWAWKLVANFRGTRSCLAGTPRCGGGMRAGQGRRSWGLRLVAIDVLDMGEAIEVVGEGKGLGPRGCGLGCSSARTCWRWVAFSLIYPLCGTRLLSATWPSKLIKGCQGHLSFCLSPGTAQRQQNPEVKLLNAQSLYSVDICRQSRYAV